MTERSLSCPPEDRLVELALGQLAGRDRAEVLEHLPSCHACSDEVDALLAITEHLLLGVEEAEPPAGFESAVLARLGPPAEPLAERRARRREPRGRSALLSAAAAAALVLVFFLGAALGPHGTSVAEAQMVTPVGKAVGSVWRYEDDPSWVFLSIPAWSKWAASAEGGVDFSLLATLDDGSTEDLGAITFDGGDGTWSTATNLDLDHIGSVSVIDATGKVWCTGVF